MGSSIKQTSFDPSKHEPLPSNIDAIAAETPNRIFLSIPHGDDGKGGWRDVTYSDFSRAVNRCAWWLKDEIGESRSFETLSYIGPHDATHLILTLACVKTGWNALSSSPNASVEDRLVLFEASQCKYLLHPQETPPMATSILEKRKISSIVLPQLDHWLQDSPVPNFPFTKTLIEAWKDPFVQVHSSGTTGNPKLIQLTHGSVATASRLQNTPDGRPHLFHLWSGLRVLLAIPISIAAGIFTMLSINVEFGWIVVLAPTVRPSAQLLDTIHRNANVQAVASLPTMYPDIVANEEFLDNLRHLKYFAYTGGPCPSHLGSQIAARTKLVTLLGSSETGPIPTEVTDDSEDWEYTKFSPVIPYRFQHILSDLYELEIIRRDGRGGQDSSSCTTTTTITKEEEEEQSKWDPEPVFSTLPHLESVYGTKDLYTPHTSKPDLWRFRGRKDDIITLSPSSSSPLSSPSNGPDNNSMRKDGKRMLFPIPLENALNAHPEIKHALVLGNGRSRPVLLIEVSGTLTTQWTEEENIIVKAGKFKEEVVWPILERVNRDEYKDPPTRIEKDRVVILERGEGMPTTTKGYVSRKMAGERFRGLVDGMDADG